MPALSPLLAHLARQTTDPAVAGDLLALTADARFTARSRMTVAVGLAGNPRLDPDLRVTLGQHRWAAVQRAVLSRGDVTVEEALTWLRDERRIGVARHALRHVDDPEGKLAAHLLARVENLRLALDIALDPDLPIQVRAAAAVRVVTHRRPPVTYVRRVVASVGRSPFGRAALEATLGHGAHQELPALLAELPAPVAELGDRYTLKTLAGWVSGGDRADAAVLDAYTGERRLRGRVTLLRTHPDPAGTLNAAVLAAPDAGPQLLFAAFAAPRLPYQARKATALRLARHAPPETEFTRLATRVSTFAAHDPAFADAFVAAALDQGTLDFWWRRPGVCTWHLSGDMLRRLAERVLTDSDSDFLGRRRIWVALSEHCPDDVRQRLLASLTNDMPAFEYALGSHDPRVNRVLRPHTALALLRTAVAAPSERPGMLRVSDLVAASRVPTDVVPGLAWLVTETLRAATALPRGLLALELLSACADDYAGTVACMCDAIDAAWR